MNLVPSRLRLIPCVAVMAVFSSTAMAQDLAQIDDPSARETVGRIVALLEDVSSYTCKARFSGAMLVGPAGDRREAEFVNEAEIEFKRPDFGHRRQVTVKHPIAWKTGEVTESYYNESYWWQCVVPEPGTGEKLADMREMPEGFDRIAFVEKQNQPKAYRYLLSAFVEADLDVDGREVDVLLEPFADCQLDTLTIISEDEDAWVFNAAPAKVFP
jgi:hypothetical protein